MRIEVFNVGHGQCAAITAPNGRRMMLDCGDRWGDDSFWTPSLHFFRQTIDLLALMNLDEDHLRDFKNVMQDCTIPWILSNPTVGSREFALNGRESGCCTELFELFRPQLVIISDDERQFDSQDTDDWYRTRCTGAVFVTNERRYVATTRKDGSIRIDVTADGGWTIQRVTVRDWPRTTTLSQPQLDLGALAALGFGHNPFAPSLSGLLSQWPPPPPPTPSFGMLNADEDSLLKALGLLPLTPYPTKR